MRENMRDAVTWLALVLISPLLLWIGVWRRFGRDPFATWAEVFAIVPGPFGNIVRRAYYHATLEDCAIDIGVGFGSFFSKRNATIKRGVSIGGYCIVGMCCIGEGTLIGSGVHIVSGRRQHGIEGSAAHKDTGVYTPVNIGQNCWIGNGAIVMNNVGDDTIVGAGSVVVHEAPSHAVVAGNPATVRRIIEEKTA
ncbi:MAG: acyltransferase [Thermoguttaceae bacterium]